MIKRSLVAATLICAVFGAASNNQVMAAQTTQQSLDKAADLAADAAAPTLAMYTGANLATKNSTIKLMKGFISNETLATTVGTKLFQYSRMAGAKSTLLVAVLVTGAAAIYKKFHHNDTFHLCAVVSPSQDQGDGKAALQSFSVCQ